MDCSGFAFGKDPEVKPGNDSGGDGMKGAKIRSLVNRWHGQKKDPPGGGSQCLAEQGKAVET